MPTDKPRLNVVLSEEEYRLVDKYRYENSISSMSKAAAELILKALGKLDNRKPAGSPFTGEELNLLNVYRHADADSKNEMRRVALKANKRTRNRQRPLTAIPENTSNNIDADQFQVLFDYFRTLNEDERAELIMSIIGSKKINLTTASLLERTAKAEELTEKSV